MGAILAILATSLCGPVTATMEPWQQASSSANVVNLANAAKADQEARFISLQADALELENQKRALEICLEHRKIDTTVECFPRKQSVIERPRYMGMGVPK